MTALFTAPPRSLVQGIEAAAFRTLHEERLPHTPQVYKDALRFHYAGIPDDSHPAGCSRRGHHACYARAVERARAFWARYEQVNRLYLPDDPVYSVVRTATALSTTADTYTMIAAAAAQFRLLEIIWGGEATASAVNRIAHQRSTGGTTGGGALTPEKFNTRSPAASTVVNTTWGAVPTLSGNPWWTLALNAFGGYVDWKAAPGAEVYCVNSEQMSMRSLAGTSLFSSTIVFEEL